jgi:nucleoside-diphosphate-sugar epimerase
MQIMIFGLGRLGSDLSKHFHNQGHQVLGTTTQDWKLGDALPRDIQESLQESDVFIFTIPPVQGLTDGLKEVLTNYPILKKRRVYVCNSISVYGSNPGEVDESNSPMPDTSRGLELLELEQSLTEVSPKIISLRLGGLFSDNRHPVYYLVGKKDLKGAGEFLNGVHHLDVARAILHIEEKKITNQRINIVWDQHPEKSAFYIKAAKELDLTTPEYLEVKDPKKKIIHSEALKKSGFKFVKPLG